MLFLATLKLLFSERVLNSYKYLYFLRQAIKHETVSIRAPASAAITAYQIPFIPKTAGRVNIAIIWKTKALAKDISADIAPLFKAVKKLDPNIFKPINMNEIEYIL